MSGETDIGAVGRRGYLRAVAGGAALAAASGHAAGQQAGAFERVWSASLPKPKNSVRVADLDGDGTEEVAVSAWESYGPSEFGVVEEGEWRWTERSTAGVQCFATGDVDGDGTPEALFKAKVDPVWVRPYTGGGERLWSGDHGDWPDQGVATDFDGDGRAEVAVVSNNRGDLTVWDHDGSVLWRTQSARLIEHLLDARSVDGDGIPELLTHQPPDDSARGIQVVRRSGSGGVERAWSYGPRAPVRASFADLDGSDAPPVLALYPESGEVHAVGRDGTARWTETLGVAGDGRVIDLTGDGVPDAVAWEGSELRVLDATTREVAALSLDDPIEWVRPFGPEGLLARTGSGLVVLDRAGTVRSSHRLDGTLTGVAIGDVDGDGAREVVTADGATLRAFDPVGAEDVSVQGGGSETTAAGTPDGGLPVFERFDAGTVLPLAAALVGAVGIAGVGAGAFLWHSRNGDEGG